MSEVTNIFSKMAGTNIKAIVRFVQEIERNPCLYDRKSIDYSNRELKKKTWMEIAEKFNSTAKQCKEKWGKIRIAYVRTLRPNYINSTGTSRGPYYLAKYLKFLQPMKNIKRDCMFLSASENNLQSDETNELIETTTVDEPTNDLDDNLDSEEYDNSQHQVFLNGDENYFDDDGDETTYDEEMDMKETFLDEINISKETEASNRNECNRGRIVKKRPCCDKIECNPRKMFLLSLLPDVETFTEKQMRSFRRNIIQMIDNVLDE